MVHRHRRLERPVRPDGKAPRAEAHRAQGAVVELPRLDGQQARHASLLAEAVARGDVREGIAADRNRHARRHGEGARQELVAVRGHHGDHVAVLLLDDDTPDHGARLAPAGRIGDEVLVRALRRVLAHSRALRRARTEATRHVAAPEVAAVGEADLRTVVRTDDKVVRAHAPSIRRVVELRLVARVVRGPAVDVRLREVTTRAEVVEEREEAVDAVGEVRRTLRQRRLVAVADDAADAAPAQDVPLQTCNGEVGRPAATDRLVTGLEVQRTNRPLAHPPGDASAGADRHDASRVEADAPTVEERRRPRRRIAVAAAAEAEPGAAAATAAAEVEDTAPLEEEVALLGKLQAEPGEVQLLFVHFHLGEVGPHGDVGGQVRGDAVLQVAADAAREVVAQRRDADAVGRVRADDVGFEVDVGALRRQVEPDERRRTREAESAVRAGTGCRQGREVRPLVFAAN